MKILTKCVNQIFTLGPWVSMTYKLQVNSNPRETYRSLLGCYVSSLLHWEVPSWPLDTVCAWKPKALTASKPNQTKQNKRNEKKLSPPNQPNIKMYRKSLFCKRSATLFILFLFFLILRKMIYLFRFLTENTFGLLLVWMEPIFMYFSAIAFHGKEM